MHSLKRYPEEKLPPKSVPSYVCGFVSACGSAEAVNWVIGHHCMKIAVLHDRMPFQEPLATNTHCPFRSMKLSFRLWTKIKASNYRSTVDGMVSQLIFERQFDSKTSKSLSALSAIVTSGMNIKHAPQNGVKFATIDEMRRFVVPLCYISAKLEKSFQILVLLLCFLVRLVNQQHISIQCWLSTCSICMKSAWYLEMLFWTMT